MPRARSELWLCHIDARQVSDLPEQPCWQQVKDLPRISVAKPSPRTRKVKVRCFHLIVLIGAAGLAGSFVG